LWKVYAKNGLAIDIDNINPLTGESTKQLVEIPNYILEALSTSVKVDITPKGAFDKYAQELSLENMFTQGKISFEEYVEALDADSVMPKTKLENILKKRKEAQKEIDNMEQQAMQMKNQMQLQMANRNEIENIANEGNNLINQATV